MASDHVDAATILARAGIGEDPTYVADFPCPRDRAVLALPQLIREAWARNSADLFSSVFSPNGSLLMGDAQLCSRDEIADFMRAGFDGPLSGARVVGWPIKVTWLTDDVALVVTEGGLILSGQLAPSPDRYIRVIWVIAKTGDTATLTSHHSTPYEPNTPIPTPGETP